MTKMLAVIKQSGPPTKNTPGAVGQDYVDIDTGLRWECVEATSEKFYKQNKVVYNWELRGLDPDFVVDGLPSDNMLLLKDWPTVMPGKKQWTGCYGSGKFVAVARGSNIAAYSTDGINWTQSTLPASAPWASVCYGAGKFVAVASGNASIAAYSTDGINWAQTALPAKAYLASVCYGAGKFVAVGFDSSVAAYSTDGINWARTALPAKAYWKSVCYGNGKFVAVVFNSSVAAYSTDGINWTQSTLPASAPWGSVCYGNGKFVAIAEHEDIAMYSTDGINWIQATVPTVECLAGTNATDDLKKALGIDAIIETPNGEGGSLPVKLDILGTVVGNKTITGSTKKYLFPSEITLNDGDLYLLVYKYFYNGVADPNKHIVAVSCVSDGEVYWGNTDPDNCVKMDKTGVYDNWLATNDDTTKSIVNVYKVQKTITDEAAYHTMHLEGHDCIAPGIHAHAEGINTVASGMYSHAEGFNTKAAGPKQHVEGSYNIVDKEGKYAYIVGNGTNESDRSNAYTLDWEGNAHFAGNVYACDAELATNPQALYFKLPVGDWVKDGDVYIQTILVGSFDDMNVYVNPIPGYENEYYNAGIATYYVREDGEFGIRFVAKALPTSDIKVYLIVQYFELNVETPPFGFMSNSSFTISARKGWDGTIEYLALDNDGFSTKWVKWFGDTITATEIPADNGTMYAVQLRGSQNTRITLGNTTAWTITGSNVQCVGNIETLLDWKKVAIDEHPMMTTYCYSDMFKNCTALVTAPALPATALTKGCYLNMFNGCTNLTNAPSLPATTLAEDCYRNMFDGCTNLIDAPSLPATTLASKCYASMFQGCTNLTHAPSLPATTLADGCYMYMFTGCHNLTSIPSLPATTLTVGCYAFMFQTCTRLKLSATQTDTYTKEYRIPATGAGTTATNALSNMFHLSGGTFTGTPEINTTYYLHKDCVIV